MVPLAPRRVNGTRTRVEPPLSSSRPFRELAVLSAGLGLAALLLEQTPWLGGARWSTALLCAAAPLFLLDLWQTLARTRR